MKLVAKILATLTVLMVLTTSVEATPKFIMPPRLRQPFVPPFRAPHKEYVPRQPFRPKPHYTPRVPQPTRDTRGGKYKPVPRR